MCNITKCFALGALVLVGPLSAQDHTHASAAAVTLVVIADGSKNPELISDEMAYSHYLIAIAELSNASAEERLRQSTQLAAVGLSPADSAIITARLGVLRGDLDQIAAARAATAPASPTSPESDRLKASETVAVRSAIADVKAMLTTDGVARLDKHVGSYVKRHIVVYGASAR